MGAQAPYPRNSNGGKGEEGREEWEKEKEEEGGRKRRVAQASFGAGTGSAIDNFLDRAFSIRSRGIHPMSSPL